MREIKFRAWNQENKEMFFSPTFDDLENTASWFSVLEDNEVGELIILMQFIGLKDKNGKEIYEGDVIRNNEACLMAKHGFINKELENYGVMPPDFISVIRDIRMLPFYEAQRIDNVEIIGNIYENPEFLTKN